MRSSTFALLLSVFLGLGACSMTDRATHFEGLTSPDGAQVSHFNTTNVGANFLFGIPLIGDAELDDAVRDLAREAKTAGFTKLQIVQSDSTNYWWCLPPFSFIISPVVANVAGDASK